MLTHRIVAIVPEAMYLAGKKLNTGSKGCDAAGFLLTTVLWTQHMWTLAIAIATYVLLVSHRRAVVAAVLIEPG